MTSDWLQIGRPNTCLPVLSTAMHGGGAAQLGEPGMAAGVEPEVEPAGMQPVPTHVRPAVA